MKRMLFTLLVMFWGVLATNAEACSVCFGQTQDKALVNALKYGVLSLLLVLGIVLGLFAHFFISFQKRAKQSS